MSIEAFDPEILQDFLTEAGELLDQLEGDLVSLEATPGDTELINQVFRALHTIKGSASFLALTNLVEIAHAAESALNAARNGVIPVDQRAMDLFLKAVDVIKVQFGEISDGSTDLTRAEPGLVAALAELGEGGGEIDDDEPVMMPGLADAADPPAGAAPGGGQVEGFERPLSLGAGKADLLEHFVADLDEQLATIGELVDELGEQTEREAASKRLGELGGELSKTADFFEHEPMLRLVRALIDSGGRAGEVEAETLEQMLVRSRAVLSLLHEQLAGLREGKLVDRPCNTLIERLDRLSRGETPESGWLVDPDGGPEAALMHDGVPARAVHEPGPEADDAEGEVSPEAGPVPEAAAADGAPKARGNNAGAPEQTIRVEVSRLETLMNLVGELVLQKNRIGELARTGVATSDANADAREQLELASGELDRVTGDIQMAVMRTRMQPLDKLFGKYPRLIRDLSQKTGKKIRLEIIGGETEVDKSVIEELGDPLVHLLRNSADHGLEPPEERESAGKDPTGTITLFAGQEGDHVRITIDDNGRGLNRERIAAKAIDRGLVSEVEAANLSDEDVARFIFMPGFSTASAVSDLSGRGVGMDVVRTNIEKLKGSIDVSTKPGGGTRFTITIPLTVAIMPAMMVEFGGETFAAPLGSIVEIVRPEADQLATVAQERVLRVRGAVIPLLDACDVFSVPFERREDGRLVLVLSWGDREVGLLVTRVIGQQEIVIKPLDGVERSGPVSGATVRNDGGVSLIIDVAELVRRGSALA